MFNFINERPSRISSLITLTSLKSASKARKSHSSTLVRLMNSLSLSSHQSLTSLMSVLFTIFMVEIRPSDISNSLSMLSFLMYRTLCYLKLTQYMPLSYIKAMARPRPPTGATGRSAPAPSSQSVRISTLACSKRITGELLRLRLSSNERAFPMIMQHSS